MVASCHYKTIGIFYTLQDLRRERKVISYEITDNEVSDYQELLTSWNIGNRFTFSDHRCVSVLWSKHGNIRYITW